MANQIVLDLETQKDFSEAGGRNKFHLLRVSVAGIYTYQEDKYQIFEEHQLYRLGEAIFSADQMIGFNIRQFDLEVLRPYLNFPIEKIPVLDILEEIEKVLGHRISLDSVASATLGTKKTGTGLEAIRLWKNGLLDDLKKYCLNDVRLTRQIYEYGRKNNKLLYRDFFETREIPVHFAEPALRENIARQTSLF